MISPRGPLAARRMTAHWAVIMAAALTTLLAATVAAALTVFTGQALPQAVRHDLGKAAGTAMSASMLVSDPGQATEASKALRARIAAAMPGIPFSFNEALWSDPLGLVPGALPASPLAGQGDTALLQAAWIGGIADHASLVAGHWPATEASSQQTTQANGQTTRASSQQTNPASDRAPIPAALPAAAAALLHVSAGDVLRLRDRITGTPVSFDITGVFVPRQESGGADSYWTLNYIPASGESVSSGSITYGPLVVSRAALGPAVRMLSGSWVARPDLAAFGEGDLGPVSASVAALVRSLPASNDLSGVQLVTSLPSVLAEAASNLSVARSTLAISALELLVLAVAALLAVARLLAAQREGETALLVARGATRSQLTRLTAAEVIPLSALVSVAGAFAGIRLAGALVTAGPLGGAGIRPPSAAAAWPGALVAAVTVTVVAAIALLVPGLTPNPAAARIRRGRQAIVAGTARASLDVCLVALALLAGWQLRHYSAASGSGTAGLDPVLALAPALALAAGSVAALRLLPLAARTAEWLAVRGRRLSAPLASWQFSRMPVRQGGAALLLTTAVAMGTLALAQHASWVRSASDQAVFATGADVQVNLPAPVKPGQARAITAATGVRHAMAVAADTTASPGEVIAVGAAQAAQVVRLRADQSALPLASLFRAITPAHPLPGAVPPPNPSPGTGPGSGPNTRAAAIPAIATSAFAAANNVTLGSVVPAFVDGTQVPMRIVAEVTSFPTVTSAGGALITDLGSLQRYLIQNSLPPLAVTQWWLATAGHGIPASLAAAVPAGTGITSASALAAATARDTLSAAPQQALLAMAAAAALLGSTGFWVSIAADVRRRRGEAALLAALGVTRRRAAVQLCLEKLLLSLPSTILGVLLGAIVARLLVPAVTLTPAARLPAPPAVTVDDLPQAIALALAVAVLPAVAAALGAVRRPDAAARLRVAEEV